MDGSPLGARAVWRDITKRKQTERDQQRVIDGLMSAQAGAPNAPEEIEKLLSRLCIDLGFCLPPAEIERLKATQCTDARSFADEVFRAEGLDPEMADRHLYRQVLRQVAESFRE